MPLNTNKEYTEKQAHDEIRNDPRREKHKAMQDAPKEHDSRKDGHKDRLHAEKDHNSRQDANRRRSLAKNSY